MVPNRDSDSMAMMLAKVDVVLNSIYLLYQTCVFEWAFDVMWLQKWIPKRHMSQGG